MTRVQPRLIRWLLSNSNSMSSKRHQPYRLHNSRYHNIHIIRQRQLLRISTSHIHINGIQLWRRHYIRRRRLRHRQGIMRLRLIRLTLMNDFGKAERRTMIMQASYECLCSGQDNSIQFVLVYPLKSLKCYILHLARVM
jgi:hypothetical protein